MSHKGGLIFCFIACSFCSILLDPLFAIAINAGYSFGTGISRDQKAIDYAPGKALFLY